ncbi:unnamed protein product [Diamesa hyperborea]
MSKKRKQTLVCDPFKSVVSSSDDDGDSTDNKRQKPTKEHSCMKYYKRLDKKMDLLQRNMDVKFNYMELLLQRILKTQTNETPFSGLPLDSYISSPSPSPSFIVKEERTDVTNHLQNKRGVPKSNGKHPKRKLPPVDEINYDKEWNERILASIKLNVPESLSSQLNCTTFDLQKTEDYTWLVTCPFCRSKLKLKVTFDVYSGNRSTNFRKTNFDYHLKRIHN